MTLACLATIEPLDPAAGTRSTIRVSSVNERRNGGLVNGLNGQVWEPALVEAPVLGLTLWNGDFQAAVAPASAALPLKMETVKKTYPAADALCWIGAPVVIYAAAPGTAWPWSQAFKGRVSGYQRQGQTLTLNAEVDVAPLRLDILTAVYAGTGGGEGSADLKNRVKPLAIGWAKNVEPVLIDATNNVYQFSSYGGIEAVTTLFERGSAFGASHGDYASYAALVAAAIPAGKWGTCLAAGMVRLGAPAFGVITGDIKGHRVGATTPRLTGAVIQALATIAGVSAGDIDSTTLAALDADVPYPINLVLTDQVTFFDQARALAIACNYQAGASLVGQFFVAGVGLTGSVALEIEAQGRRSPQVVQSEETDVSVPYWRTVLGANRSWRVHSADEIAFTAPLIPVGPYDGATVYREGNIIEQGDGSRWVYINVTPGSGNAPPTWPTTSNAYWENTAPPLSAADLTYVDGVTLEARKPAEAAATRGAPTGTPVGSITAADVAGTIKSGGGVAAAKVDTPAIQDSAATTAKLADEAAAATATLFYNNGGGTVGTAGSYVGLPGGPAAISVTTGTKAGQQCLIKALVGLRRGGGANDFVTLRCRREDGTILAQTYTIEITNDQFIVPAAFVDPSPVASTTHTYTLQINTDDSATQVREVFIEGLLSKTG